MFKHLSSLQPALDWLAYLQLSFRFADDVVERPESRGQTRSIVVQDLEVSEKMTSELLSIMDQPLHPLHVTLQTQQSFLFSVNNSDRSL